MQSTDKTQDDRPVSVERIAPRHAMMVIEQTGRRQDDKWDEAAVA
jgi:hypothetical protein